MLTVYNLISRFITILVKILTNICGYQQTDSKILMEKQNTQHGQPNIEAEEQSLRINTTHLKTYCKATVVKIVQKWENELMEQNKEPQINPC